MKPLDCPEATEHLVAHALGALDDAERGEVEAHLLGCRACLEEYFALKRAMDRAEDVPAPSPAAKARLRRAVAVELGLAAPLERRPRWERPVAVLIAAAAVAAASAGVRVVTDLPGAPPYALGAGR